MTDLTDDNKIQANNVADNKILADLVCIGSLGQQKVYLHWSDVKDICTYAVSVAYEQTKRENAQLKELLRECLAHLTIGKYGTSVTPINILCDEVEEVLK